MASSSKKDGSPERTKPEEKAESGKNAEAQNQSDSSDEDDGTMAMLRRYMAQKLGLSEDTSKPAEKIKILDDVSIDGVIKYIKDKNCRKIITMAGAGISTSSGIPDFRSPGSGLYDNLEKYHLPDPQAIFEIGFFREHPQPFFALAKELYPGTFKPTPCHYFLKLLNEKGLLLRHYTQNIDTLEHVAGIPREKLVEAHGTFHTSHCLSCHAEYSLEWMKERIFSDTVPTCEKCNHIVKPDIVFFGENLPSRFFTCAKQDFPQCDLLIILGSSLTVEPFASLSEQAPKSSPRLLINRTKTGQRNAFMAFMGMGGGLNFDAEDNTRDVAWLGDCDEGCRLLASGLGWGEELDKLVAAEHARIDAEKAKAAAGAKKPSPEKPSQPSKSETEEDAQKKENL